MAARNSNVVRFTPSKESALAELRRKLNQSYALIYGARMILANLTGGERAAIEPADRLLDMAEDVLSDLEYINRVQPVEAEEVANG